MSPEGETRSLPPRSGGVCESPRPLVRPPPSPLSALDAHVGARLLSAGGAGGSCHHVSCLRKVVP